jgi:hypothetical protein
MLPYIFLQYYWVARVHCKFKSYHNYALFKYEDLLENPLKTIQQLCNFIEVPFEKKMLNPNKGQESSLTLKDTSGFDKTALVRWRKVISPIEFKILTTLTKKSMQHFEYKAF